MSFEDSETCKALVKKVREQALELTELNDKLAVANDHIALAERRIDELISTSVPGSARGSPSRLELLSRKQKAERRTGAGATSLSPQPSPRRTTPVQASYLETIEVRAQGLEKELMFLQENLNMTKREKASMESTLVRKTDEAHRYGIENQRLTSEVETLRVQLEYMNRSSDPSNLKRMNKAAAAIAKSQTVIVQDELRRVRQQLGQQEKIIKASSQREKVLVGQVHSLEQELYRAGLRRGGRSHGSDIPKDSTPSFHEYTRGANPLSSKTSRDGRGAADVTTFTEDSLNLGASTGPSGGASHGEEKAALCEEILRLQEQNKRLSSQLERSSLPVPKAANERDDTPHSTVTENQETAGEATAEEMRELLEQQARDGRAVFNQLQTIQEELVQSQTELVKIKKAEMQASQKVKEMEACASDVSHLEAQIGRLTTSLVEAEGQLDIVKEQKAAADNESKELSRMQETLLEQAKEAAARTHQLETELLSAQEGEAKAVSEVASLRAATASDRTKEHLGNVVHKYEAVCRELEATKEHVELMKVGLANAESEKAARGKVDEELELLRPLQQAFFELEEDMRPYSRPAPAGVSYSDDPHWPALPSVRNINSTLSHLLSQLLEDYRDSRQDRGSGSADEVVRLTSEVESLKAAVDVAERRAARAESEASSKQKELSSDINSLRAGMEVLKQLKYLVVSSKAGLRLLHSHLPHLVPALARDDGDESHNPAGRSTHRNQGQGQFSPARSRRSATCDACSPVRRGGAVTAGEEKEERDANLILHFADHMLPEIVSRSLINLETATKRSTVLLKDVEESDTELRDLELRHRDVVKDLERAQVDLDDAKQRVVAAENEAAFKAQEVDDLLSLGEKQQAVVAALENKMANLVKDRSLRLAQASSWQQREEAIRTRLAAALRDYGAAVPTSSGAVSSAVSPAAHPLWNTQGQPGYAGVNANTPGAVAVSLATVGMDSQARFTALQSMRMTDLLQMVTDTLAALYRVVSTGGSSSFPSHAREADISRQYQETQQHLEQREIHSVITSVPPVSAPLPQALAARAPPPVAALSSSGGSEDSLGLSVSESSNSAPTFAQSQPKVGRPRVTIAEPEVKVTTADPPRRSPPGTVAADIEAAMESDPVSTSGANRERRGTSLLPGDDVLGELGSPVTQLQARLSQAKKAFSDLREGHGPQI